VTQPTLYRFQPSCPDAIFWPGAGLSSRQQPASGRVVACGQLRPPTFQVAAKTYPARGVQTKHLRGGSASATAGVDCATGQLQTDGSTARRTGVQRWIQAYETKCSGSQINYGGNGSARRSYGLHAEAGALAGSDSHLKPEQQGPADARCLRWQGRRHSDGRHPGRDRLQRQRRH